MHTGIRFLQYGLGPIGIGIARMALSRSGVQIVGGIDVDPRKVGRSLDEILEVKAGTRITVQPRLADVVTEGGADIVLHSTGSALATVFPQIVECLRAGLSVISTCEELSYPEAQHPELAERLDSLAKQHHVRVLGTGINPGYAMDFIALVLSGVCERVERIAIRRRVDAAGRRLPLQKKVGAGLTVMEFQQLVQAQTVRHVGLVESAAMLADALGWEFDRVEDVIGPVVAEKPLRSQYLEVQPGGVAGVYQVFRGYVKDREVLTLDLMMALGVEDPGDRIQIWGINDLEMSVNGIRGDLATAAMVVNSIPRVLQAPPGLLTMKDIAPPICWA